ncbi:MAG: hypothetical protein ACK4WB_04035 [Desulfatiglandales bacterium]
MRERPEWLEELRRLILTEEVLALPQKFEAFRKDFERYKKEEFLPVKEKVDKIEQEVGVLKQDVGVLKQDVAVLKQDVEVLKQDVAALKQDVEVLKQDVAVLKQDVAVLKQDVAVLKQDVAVLKQDVAVLKQDVVILKIDVAELKGENFERRVREKAPSYFGRFIRKCRVISHEKLADILDDAVDNGVISEEEREDALNIDVVATGFLRKEREKKVVIVTEVSIKADKVDVERAYERAMIVGKAMNLSSIAVVIGKEYTKGAEVKAKELNVILC